MSALRVEEQLMKNPENLKIFLVFLNYVLEDRRLTSESDMVFRPLQRRFCLRFFLI